MAMELTDKQQAEQLLEKIADWVNTRGEKSLIPGDTWRPNAFYNSEKHELELDLILDLDTETVSKLWATEALQRRPSNKGVKDEQGYTGKVLSAIVNQIKRDAIGDQNSQKVIPEGMQVTFYSDVGHAAYVSIAGSIEQFQEMARRNNIDLTAIALGEAAAANAVTKDVPQV